MISTTRRESIPSIFRVFANVRKAFVYLISNTIYAISISTVTELARNLSLAVNREARLRYSPLAKKTGAGNFTTTHLPRLALRLNTPYPYELIQDDALFPTGKRAFGRIIQASRQEGLDEIHTTISEQSDEHGWLFIPEISSWIDVTQQARDSEAHTDQYIETFASYMFDEVEHMHTHPDKVVRALSQDEPWSYSQNYLMEAARLSGGDIVRYAQMAARAAQTAKLASSVVSHYGVTTLSLRSAENKNVSFTHKANLDTRILEASPDPIADIVHNLSRIAANLVSFDTEEPVFTYQFQAFGYTPAT